MLKMKAAIALGENFGNVDRQLAKIDNRISSKSISKKPFAAASRWNLLEYENHATNYGDQIE